MKSNKALTWDDLANIYNSTHNGRQAQTLPMNQIFDWAARQTDKFKVTNDGSIHLIQLEG